VFLFPSAAQVSIALAEERKPMDFSSYVMEFDGQVLERGFWLYVWEILYGHDRYIYVGRTGDSSSPNASSPFSRIGQHLDFRKNARGNSLAKRLREAGVNPSECKFRMLALGPFFREQDLFEAHKPYRDQMASYEYETAAFLREMRFNVLGTHQKGKLGLGSDAEEIKTRIMQFLTNESSS
jgi:hypothetical protein